MPNGLKAGKLEVGFDWLAESFWDKDWGLEFFVNESNGEEASAKEVLVFISGDVRPGDVV